MFIRKQTKLFPCHRDKHAQSGAKNLQYRPRFSLSLPFLSLKNTRGRFTTH